MILCFQKDSVLFLIIILIVLIIWPLNLVASKAEVFADEALNNVHLRGEIWYGEASWYGGRFHGRKTSNGEKYNKKQLTAAHKSLPFDTYVMVTNVNNNKSVVVRINDRGPFIGDRIIDLSEEAAELIEVKKGGIGLVKVQVLNPII